KPLPRRLEPLPIPSRLTGLTTGRSPSRSLSAPTVNRSESARAVGPVAVRSGVSRRPPTGTRKGRCRTNLRQMSQLRKRRYRGKPPATVSLPRTSRCPSGSTTSIRAHARSRYHAAVLRATCPLRPSQEAMPSAIIKVAGKQYRVREGERLLVDRLHQDEGATFAPTVLLVGGDGAAKLDPGDGVVTAKVLGDTKGPKIRIGKYKKRTGYKRHTGFRASLTQIQIESIGAGKPARASSKAKAESVE